MMDCNGYRRSLLAEPHGTDQQSLAHLAACPECTRYREEVLKFEGRLGRALRVDMPAGRVITLRPARAAWRAGPRWLAAAASVLLATAVAGVLWLAAPGRSLAADVVAHMAEEPDAWRRTDAAVPDSQLAEVFRDSQLRLQGPAGLVTYANSCTFRGRKVPHFVVQTADGPITVMVLAHESTGGVVRFNEQGYQGLIVPVPHHGSIAVLEKGAGIDATTIEDVAARVRTAVDWAG